MAMQWTPERVEALRRKIIDERKPSQIVAAELTREFGYRVTRNAVMGKAVRESLPFAHARGKYRSRPALAAQTLKVGMFECRYIEGDHYCGRPTVHAGSWCAEHRARVWLRR